MSGVGGAIATVLIRTLEALFAIGIIGSAVVIILATVEDARTLRGKDDKESS